MQRARLVKASTDTAGNLLHGNPPLDPSTPQRLGRISLIPFEGGKQCRGRRVVAKGLAEVGEAIDVPWAKDKTPAKLKGIHPQFVLTMPVGPSAATALEIVPAEQVKQIGDPQVCELVGLALFVDEQGEVDPRFFLENACIIAVAKANGCQGSAFVGKGLLVFAQLRDVFAAKDSTIVAKKNDDRGLALPQRSQADFLAKSVRQNDICEPLAESLLHDGHD